MAQVIATIDVNFTSNYAGCHRLFWRKTPSGPYTGPVEATPPCTGAGNPCSISIYDIVDTESCENVTYNGYVQPCCVSADSEEYRTPFTAVFTPTPTCFSFTITCSKVEVDTLRIINPGAGYDGTETITISGGGYTIQATATPIVGTGLVETVMMSYAGVGPDQAPATYTPVGVTGIVSPSGGASVTMTIISENTCPGPIYPCGGYTYVSQAIVLASTGTWSIGDTFYIDPTGIGNIGTIIPLAPVSFVVTDTDEGKIIGVTMTNNGSGYGSNPVVSILPPNGTPIGSGGVQAILGPIMAACPDNWQLGPNCDGNDYSGFPIEPALGESFQVCIEGGTIVTNTLPSQYATPVPNPGNCCSTCSYVRFDNSGSDPVDIAYIVCDPSDLNYNDWVTDTIAGSGGMIEVCCVKNDSWVFTDSTNIVVTVLGTCADCVPPIS